MQLRKFKNFLENMQISFRMFLMHMRKFKLVMIA